MTGRRYGHAHSDGREDTTAAPVPDAGEDDWEPLGDEREVVADGGQTTVDGWTGRDA